ncbi:MAG: hypothetical protein R6U40_07605, partial [Desulfobacterales bacterium]
MKFMKIGLLASVGANVGMGHYVRARSFGDTAVKLGHEAKAFAFSDKISAELDICPGRCKFENYSSIEQCIENLLFFGPDVIVLDLPGVPQEAARRLKASGACIVCLSPSFTPKSIVDIAFFRADVKGWPESTKIYAGIEYCILSDSLEHVS